MKQVWDPETREGSDSREEVWDVWDFGEKQNKSEVSEKPSAWTAVLLQKTELCSTFIHADKW